MKSLSFCLAVLSLSCLSSFASAETKIIQVMGQDVEVRAASYLSDGSLQGFEVTKPATFSMARGNKVTVYGSAYVHRNGNLSLVVSAVDQELHWKLPNGQVIRFDCNPRLTPQMEKKSRWP